jgi:hypothetical protein
MAQAVMAKRWKTMKMLRAIFCQRFSAKRGGAGERPMAEFDFSARGICD